MLVSMPAYIDVTRTMSGVGEDPMRAKGGQALKDDGMCRSAVPNQRTTVLTSTSATGWSTLTDSPDGTRKRISLPEDADTILEGSLCSGEIPSTMHHFKHPPSLSPAILAALLPP